MNDQQYQAATIRNKRRICVVAGPGSGKTYVLEQRVRLIEDEFRYQRSRVILTFTNAGAHELSERLRGCRCEYIGTLHGYCFRLVQQHGQLLRYREGGVNLIGETEAEELLKTVAKEMGWGKKSMKSLRARDSRDAEQIWIEYGQRLKRDNMVDYDTVLEAAAKLLVFPAVREAAEVDELYIDEAQDSAEVDWLIYDRLPALCKFVVGDPDQGIFAFRGAWPRGFHQFADTADEVIRLEWNYRSGRRICEAASRLIANNSNRLPKEVKPALVDVPGQVTVTEHKGDYAETESIIAQVRRLLDETAKPEEIAILCRRNKESGGVQWFTESLKEAGIPVANPHKGFPLDYSEWRHGIDVLSLFHDPRSDMIAGRVIAALVGPEKLAAAQSAKLLTGRWLSDEARRMGYLPRTLLDFIETLPNVPPALAQWGVSAEVVDLIAQRIKLIPQADARLQDLLHDLFNHEKWQPGGDTAGVTVSTLHGAKGREWPVVFLPAFEDGTVPTLRKDSTPETLEEERRLAFVGMTRAKHQLRISWAAARGMYGRLSSPSPSRFIREAGL